MNIEIIGDITLHLDFWDCDCVENYIHNISDNKCDFCGALQEDCPSSRLEEVEAYNLI